MVYIAHYVNSELVFVGSDGSTFAVYCQRASINNMIAFVESNYNATVTLLP